MLFRLRSSLAEFPTGFPSAFLALVFLCGSGKASDQVGLRDLVELALRNDPALVALRESLPVAQAETRAAAQWRDPELRVGFDKDENLYQPRPGLPPDRVPGDQTNNIAVRFWIPKPGEMKALVEEAASRMKLADYRVTATEREVILDVREKYEELRYLQRKLEASRRQIEIIEEHAARENALLESGGDLTLDQLGFEDLKIPGMKMALDSAETELAAAKRELAARVGLSDGARISLGDRLVQRGIDLQDTDLDYLVLMAFAHRGEVGVLQHEQAIAEAELGIVRREQIPWFSYLQTDYGEDVVGGGLADQGYGIQVGVILPLFSWLAKDEKVAEARVQSYYAMLEANQKTIANEVVEAFRSVREASRHRDRTAAAVAKHTAAMDRRVDEMESSENLAARERLRYDAATEQLKLQEYGLAADRLYDQSLLRLERALGTDLDQVFRVEFESDGMLSAPSSEVSRLPIRAVPIETVPPSETPARGASKVFRKHGR